MRIALISDIHGNPIALDAVLGDIVAMGHDPAGVLERLTALANPMFIRGNTDRYVVTGERPPPSLEEAATDSALPPVVAEIAGSFAWTAGYLAATGWIEWLAALPTEHRRTHSNIAESRTTAKRLSARSSSSIIPAGAGSSNITVAS